MKVLMAVMVTVLWVNLLAFAQQVVTPAEPLPVCTNAQQLLQLPPEAAARGYPVQIEGVITFFDPDWSILFIQDDTGGIYVSSTGTPADLQAGHRVRVEGVSDASDVMNIVKRGEITPLGPGKLTPSKPPTPQALLTGTFDSQWIRLAGVVRKVTVADRTHTVLELSDSQRRWNIFVHGPAASPQKTAELLDATVQLEGVGAVSLDEFKRIKEFKLFVPNRQHCIITQAPSALNFDSPTQTIASVQQLDPKSLPSHRLHVRGVVTLPEAGPYLIIQDATAGIRVQRSTEISLNPGDLVDVLGYYAPGTNSPCLEDAMLNRLGTAPLPKPVKIQADKLVWKQYDSQLVQLEGTLLEQLASTTEKVFVIQAGNNVFSAKLPLRPEESAAYPPNGSRLRLTGVCFKQTDQAGQFQTFQILLSQLSQIEIIERAEYINLKPALRILGVLAAVLAAALIWVALLKFRVQKQTEMIRERLEHEMALEKRCHELIENAHEIIFTLDQSHCFTSINPAGESLLGYPENELLGKSIGHIAFGGLAAAREWLEPAKDGQQQLSREVTLISKSGQQTVLEISLRPAQPGAWQGIARNITERKRLEAEREQLIADLKAALENVKTLSGLLPICASCKKIRDDKGYWNRIESYLTAHSQVQFTHGMCPECTRKFFPEN